jgi:pimeloyl-ACP methyl ester carboxylesterase
MADSHLVVLENAAHLAFIEHPTAFSEAVRLHIDGNATI